MQKWQQWEAASESDWGLAEEREGVNRPLAERPKLNIDDVEDATLRLDYGSVGAFSTICIRSQLGCALPPLSPARSLKLWTTVLALIPDFPSLA
jgi:hypothetical protein